MTATSIQPSAKYHAPKILSLMRWGAIRARQYVVAGCSASALKNPRYQLYPATALPDTLETAGGQAPPELKGGWAHSGCPGVVTME